MTDATPEDTPELEPARGFDSARLIADVRRGDPAMIAEAYRLTFGTALGRVVLLHALTSIGHIGERRGAEPLEQSNHNNGRASAVLEIAGLAGFDPTSIAAAGLTQTLEGADYERHYGHHHHDHGRHGPGVIFNDDGFDGGAAGGPDDGTVPGFGDGDG